jgi:hypothetical protein
VLIVHRSRMLSSALRSEAEDKMRLEKVIAAIDKL